MQATLNAALAALFNNPVNAGTAVLGLPHSQPVEHRLELLLQIRSRVLSNAIHELRTPLVAVRGYAQLLLEEQAGPLNAKQSEYLTVVVENAAKLVALLNQLQDLPTPGQLWPESIDLKELWRESFDALRERAAQKSIRVIERIAEEPLMIAGEREQLGFVLQRLLSNAVTFTNIGGEIRVDIDSEPHQIVIRIFGTGDGIPPKLTGETFDRRGRNTDAPFPGSAEYTAGPSIEEIVQMHGGRVFLTSALGEGGIVVLTLPVIQLAGAEAAQRYGQASSLGSR